jgi:murein DD-endopeptidase MepM/ murein hydrolase activator NlpD
MKKALAVMLLLAAPAAARKAPKVDEQHLRHHLRQIRRVLHIGKAALNEANAREKDLGIEIGVTGEKLGDFSTRLREVRTDLDTSQTRLELIQRTVAQSQSTLRASQAQLEKRLVDIEMNGQTNYLSVLLRSDSFADFINQAEYLQRIIEDDQKLIDQVRVEKAAYERQQRDAEAALGQVQNLRRSFEEHVLGLRDLKSHQASLLARVQTHRQKLASFVDGLEHVSAAEEHKLEVTIRERARAVVAHGYSPPSAGHFAWPVHGPITSPFGYRVHPVTGVTRFHSGIDIGVDYGTPVRAADHGTVIMAGWYGGYGNCVIIQHRGDLSTLYGHNSKLLVHEGERVRQGQVISLAGSTGMSTGPHCHFEVRASGTPVDPFPRL